MTSRYHDSRISGSQQSFLTETTICIVERWKKSNVSAIMHRKDIFRAILAGPRFVEIQKFGYHGNVR